MNDLDVCLEAVSRSRQPSTVASHSPLNISETVRDRDLIPKDHQHEMVYAVSYGNVTDDVT